MASFKVFAICILACVFLNTANATRGYGSDLRGLGLAGLAIPYPALRDPTPAAAYGGTGRGNVGVAGLLPVRGETALTGQVPIIGAVEYAGCVPAAGVVTIKGSCGCGCGRY